MALIPRPINNLRDIYNNHTINIFSDASTRKGLQNTTAACYSAIATNKDNIFDSITRVHTNTTSNAEEQRGIRAALELALKYRYNAPRINIFSDSLISIHNIRDAYDRWYFDREDRILYKVNGVAVANQEIVVECSYMLKDLLTTNEVNIYYQPGHINVTKESITAIKEATKKFVSNNYMNNGKVDYNLIRYISTYNDCVDSLSRSVLYRTNVRDTVYSDALVFYPTDQISF